MNNENTVECFQKINFRTSKFLNSYYKVIINTVRVQKAWLYFYAKKRSVITKMKTYIYPENLRASVKLWFWSVRDFIIICTGLILSVVVLVNLWNVLPIAATASYAFLSLRADETSIIDYIFNAVKFFLTSQQEYKWKLRGEN